MIESRTTKIWEEYKDCIAYRKTIGLDEEITQNRDFYEGRHWGKVEKGTEDMPRPMFNMVEKIVDNKVSGIASTPLRIVFSSNQNQELARKLNDFNEFEEKAMNLPQMFEEAITDAAVESAAILHFYWDKDFVGLRNDYRGGVQAEKINLQNIGVYNPKEQDVQKQKWIIIQSRISVETAKKMCQSKEQASLIEEDEEFRTNDSADFEQNNTKLCTLLTKYYKIDGQVYFDQATKGAILCEKKALSPKVGAKDGDVQGNEYLASLYPVAIYAYKAKKNCIFGRSEVTGLIANNRTINWNTGMMAMSIEHQAFGSVVQKEDAAPTGQKVSNDPREVLIDKCKTGQGYYTLNKQPFSPEAMSFNSEIFDLTRQTAGATEVMSGEVMGANQSGTSIALLQQQAQKPIDKLAKRYQDFRKACAKILMQFYILYYHNKKFTRMQKNADGTETEVFDTFSGEECEPYDFEVTVDVGVSTQFSDVTLINMLENRLASGQISLKTYYKVYPNLPNRDELIEDAENIENGQLQQMATQMQQMQAQLEQAQQLVAAQQEVVNNISATIKENNALKALIAEQQAQIQSLQTQGSQTYTEAQELARMLYNSQNNGGNVVPVDQQTMQQ